MSRRLQQDDDARVLVSRRFMPPQEQDSPFVLPSEQRKSQDQEKPKQEKREDQP